MSHPPLMTLPPGVADRWNDGRHAARPGSGPPGETCGSCHHLLLSGSRGQFRKCGKMRGTGSRSARSDVRKEDLACVVWQVATGGLVNG
jgi:hypothetical protein